VWHQLRDGLIAGYGIAIPLGAIAVLIIATGARHGFAAAGAAGLGAATADLTYATVAVAAGGALRPQLTGASNAIHLASGCVLTTVAIQGVVTQARARHRPASNQAAESRRTYIRFLGLTLINPLTVVYFTAIVIGNRAATGPADGIAFVTGVALASASWQTLLAACGTLLRRALPPRASLGTAMLGNCIVLALAAHQFASV
jgi:threonine/homoserine/homoserine lactone efflux protein